MKVLRIPEIALQDIHRALQEEQENCAWSIVRRHVEYSSPFFCRCLYVIEEWLIEQGVLFPRSPLFKVYLQGISGYVGHLNLDLVLAVQGNEAGPFLQRIARVKPSLAVAQRILTCFEPLNIGPTQLLECYSHLEFLVKQTTRAPDTFLVIVKCLEKKKERIDLS